MVEVGTQKLQALPASIMAYYIINELAEMTKPSDKGDWPIYTGHLPDGTNVETNAGVIYDTPGTQDMRSMNGKVPEHPGIQIRIRSNNRETGYVKIENIARALDDVFNASITIGTVAYLIQSISRTSPIISLGVEEGTKRRFHFTVNYVLTIQVTN